MPTGGVDGWCRREVPTGGDDGRCRREVPTGGADGRCRREVTTGGVDGRCRREVSTGGDDGRCRREVSTGGVDGRCRPDDITHMMVTKQPMHCQADDVGVPCVSNTTLVVQDREHGCHRPGLSKFPDISLIFP